MHNIINIPDIKNCKRIVIVGGGFAGLEFAKKIKFKYYQVVMLDKVNYYQFQPLLYQVATAGLDSSSISYPHRKAFQKKSDFHFRMCEVQRVIPEKNLVETSIGHIHYDYLVVATGSRSNYFGNDELKDLTFSLKSVSDALLMRNKILLSFEQALSMNDKSEFQKTMTFVVVGGGATGIELAGALADMRKTILPKDYPELDFSQMEIHIVDASPRLLATMSEEASKNTRKELEKRNVIIHQDVSLISYEADCVEISNGEKIYSNNVFWAAGIEANSIDGLREEVYMKKRLLVDEYNRVKGYENIFCVGDTALMITDKYPRGHPQLAQPALQMAKNLAKNMNGHVKGQTVFHKFEYKDKGNLATIGRNSAVADLGRFKFSGMIAWWLWLVVHVLSIAGMKNKLIVFINWAWSYFTYDAALRLIIFPKFSKIYKR